MAGVERAVVITGAGSGMGQELAKRAIARGDFTIATVRQADEAAALGDHPNLCVVEMDVGSSASVEDGFSEIDRILNGRPLALVINCAGISPSGALEVEPLATLEHTLNINTLGTARMIRAALPRLRGHNGRILLFASLWGKVGGPLLSAYCASKHAVEAIVDSTRREIEGQDVDIVLIEPGVVRTNMVTDTVNGSRAGSDQLPEGYRPLYGRIYDNFASMVSRESSGGVSVAQAADIIEKAAFTARPKTRYSVGKDAVAVKSLARLLPDRALDSVFRKMMAKG